eukprot:6193995-Pleurochrysis_carterae.AAC.1
MRASRAKDGACVCSANLERMCDTSRYPPRGLVYSCLYICVWTDDHGRDPVHDGPPRDGHRLAPCVAARRHHVLPRGGACAGMCVRLR